MYGNVMLSVTHPQYMFYERKESSVAVRQDLTFEDAYFITDLEFSMDTEYYQLKKWNSKVLNVNQREDIKAT